jgi:hypothetical protein
MQLDRTRPYAQIVGDDFGRFYEQDARYYTASGQLWTAPAPPPDLEAEAVDTPAPAAAPPPRRKREAAPSAADAQIAAQLGA